MDIKEKYGNTALITGASSGIGAAFARELAARGLDLILVARREERLNQMAAEFAQQHGVKTLVLAQDLAAPRAGEAVERRVREAGLEVDILVNNAGFGVYEQFGEGDMGRDLAMVDLHCRAVVDLTWRFLPAMKQRRRGAVVIVSSVLALVPAPYLTTYAATKAFDRSLGESLYGELRPYGIDALAVLPTLTETEFHAGAGMARPWFIVRQAEDVVRTTLRALGKKPSIVDGLMTRTGLALAGLIPRKLLISLYGAYRQPPDI